MPPGNSEKMDRLKREAGDGELPYISKSRVKEWKHCKRSFYFKYIKGIREDDNWHMKKGRRIHEAYEDIYESAVEQAEERGIWPNLTQHINRDKRRSWGKWKHHLANWLNFEVRRMEAAGSVAEWIPVGVEEELWLDNPSVEGSPPWMGFADLIVRASTVPEVDSDTGVVIIDFKTGKVPDPKYRNEGIYLEGSYYSILWEGIEGREDVAAVAGYYPQSDTFLVTPPDESRREEVRRVVREMVAAGTDLADFPKTEQPLCCYGTEEGEQCFYYQGPDVMNITMADPEEGECNSEWGSAEGPGPTYNP